MKLRGKVAIVTGGSGDIGRVIVEEFAKEGADVVFTYHNDVNEADSLIFKTKIYERKILKTKCDIKNSESVNKLVDFTIKNFKKIDILVNNAGIGYQMPLLDTTEDIWENTMNVNLKGVFLLTKAVLPFMIKQNYGKIVNIGSMAGTFGLENHSAYAASKSALLGFTTSLAGEVGAYNINANVISPGSIRTSDKSEDDKIRLAQKVPMGKIGDMYDIARAVVFLSSSDSDFITGHNLIVDGGRGMVW